MKLYRDGDRSRAFCADCAKVVSTVFTRRDVPFSDGKGVVKNILAGTCEHCGQVVTIPAQSAPAIAEARARETASLEAVLPAIYVDVLDLAVHRINPQSSSEFRRPLLSYFFHQYAHKPSSARQLLRAHQKIALLYPEQRGGLKRRLSLKVSSSVASDVQWLLEATDLSKTELIKSLVYEIQQSVLETPKLNYIRDLKAIATYVSH